MAEIPERYRNYLEGSYGSMEDVCRAWEAAEARIRELEQALWGYREQHLVGTEARYCNCGYCKQALAALSAMSHCRKNAVSGR